MTAAATDVWQRGVIDSGGQTGRWNCSRCEQSRRGGRIVDHRRAPALRGLVLSQRDKTHHRVPATFNRTRFVPPLRGLGILWSVNPGRRSRTRFALGYYLPGFQPFHQASGPSHLTPTLSPSEAQREERRARIPRLTKRVVKWHFVNTMNEDAKDTFSRRLRQARVMRALSLRGLAETLKGAVSHNALAKYENGEMMAGSDVLGLLSDALKQPPDFFFRPFTLQLKEIKFRKHIGFHARHRI